MNQNKPKITILPPGPEREDLYFQPVQNDGERFPTTAKRNRLASTTMNGIFRDPRLSARERLAKAFLSLEERKK